MNGENSGSAVTYTYDANDNRLTKVAGSTTTTTVPGTSNKISAVGAAGYIYDNAGNITADGVTTYYVYGAGGLLYGEYNGSGALRQEYVYLNGSPLAQIKAGSPEVLTYIHTDHLGTPRFGTSTGGSTAWTWASDAFGVGAPSGSRTINLRMAGQYFDSESGLFYNWNRYYNPNIGRYVSSDPIGLEGGLNPFSYAEASPVMYTDPEGLTFVEWATDGAILDASTPDPTDASWPKWLGWGTAIGVTGVIDWCILNNANTPSKPVAENPPSEEEEKESKGNAAADLPDLTGKPPEEAEQALEEAGFKDAGTTSGGYKKYTHPDGSTIWIRPDGEVIRQGPKVQNPDPNKKGYKPRYDQNGEEIPYDPTGQSDTHGTGEKILQ